MDEAVGSEIGARRRQVEVITFCSLTVLGAVVMCGAWLWLGLASTEQVTESAKAPPGDTSTEGLFVIFGVVPLVIVHLLGLAILQWTAPRARGDRGTRWIMAAAAVLVASAVGLAVAMQVNGGVLLAPDVGGYAP